MYTFSSDLFCTYQKGNVESFILFLRNSADPFASGVGTRSPTRMKASASDGILSQGSYSQNFQEDQSLAAGLQDLTSVVCNKSVTLCIYISYYIMELSSHLLRHLLQLYCS